MLESKPAIGHWMMILFVLSGSASGCCSKLLAALSLCLSPSLRPSQSESEEEESLPIIGDVDEEEPEEEEELLGFLAGRFLMISFLFAALNLLLRCDSLLLLFFSSTLIGLRVHTIAGGACLMVKRRDDGGVQPLLLMLCSMVFCFFVEASASFFVEASASCSASCSIAAPRGIAKQ